MSVYGVTYWEIGCDHAGCSTRSDGAPFATDAVEGLESQGWLTSEVDESLHFCPEHGDDAYEADDVEPAAHDPLLPAVLVEEEKTDEH